MSIIKWLCISHKKSSTSLPYQPKLASNAYGNRLPTSNSCFANKTGDSSWSDDALLCYFPVLTTGVHNNTWNLQRKSTPAMVSPSHCLHISKNVIRSARTVSWLEKWASKEDCHIQVSLLQVSFIVTSLNVAIRGMIDDFIIRHTSNGRAKRSALISLVWWSAFQWSLSAVSLLTSRHPCKM